MFTLAAAILLHIYFKLILQLPPADSPVTENSILLRYTTEQPLNRDRWIQILKHYPDTFKIFFFAAYRKSACQVILSHLTVFCYI